MDSEVGLEISRHLIGEKLAGQLSVLERGLAPDGEEADQVRRCIEALGEVTSLTGVRLVESRAALAYWSVWSDVAVRFGTPSLRTVPSSGPGRTPDTPAVRRP